MSTSWLLKSGLQRLGGGGSSHAQRDDTARNGGRSGGSAAMTSGGWATAGHVLAETFEGHWLQLREIAAHNVSNYGLTNIS